MYDKIPKDWTVAKLGELVITEKGKKPKRVSKERTKEFSIPYVNIKAFEKRIIDEYTDGVGCVLCEDDDFLMVWDGSRSGYVGKAIKGALGSTLVKIKLPLMNQGYAYYFLQSKFTEINTRAKGVGIPHVDPNLLWNYDFPIAPLPEQKCIVAKLEQLLTDLDKGVEYLKTAQQQLKTYRQAVLKWAFEGKLTHPDVKDGELPEGWTWKKHSEIAEINPKLPFDKIDDDLEVSFVPMKLVEEEKNKIHLTEFKKYRDVKKGFTSFSNGDIIFAKITPCMENGKCAVVQGLKNSIGFGSTEFHVSRPRNGYNPYYIFYYLIQERFRREASKHFTGSVGQKRVPTSFFSEVLIPIPHVSSEQTKIVLEIESRLSVCDKLEETIANALQQAEALRLSIIKKAFEGRLLSEAERSACRNDPDWEPAHKLLERIKASQKNHEKTSVKTRKHKKKSYCSDEG